MFEICYTNQMHTLDLDSFNELLKVADIKPRIKSELKFIKSTEHLPEDWSNYELIAISDRTGDKGVLLLEPDSDLYIVQYELSRKIIDFKTGRRRAVICDFCYTWQAGSNASSITFSVAGSKRKVRFLCCGDLKCSQHVRSLTKASKVSRTQLRENITNEGRVIRFKEKLREKINQLELVTISTSF
jgi:hypothetical protein